MSKRFDREIALIGAENFARIAAARVLVVGLGGVGGAAVETLARSGVGHLTLVDGDVFEETNMNRQVLCVKSALGRSKAETAALRVAEINPDAEVTAVSEFVNASNVQRILDGAYTYCIDAIDDVGGKFELISGCKARAIPIVSAMGAGNRTDCSFEYADIFETKYDPFARAMRRALKGKIESLDVVCAKSPPLVKSGTPASFAAPPIVMGAMLANFVLTRLIEL